jgi:hypothetical protein
MAYGNLCMRCGLEEEDHIANLVLEPRKNFPWFWKRKKGYKLSCVACCETNLPIQYVQEVKKTSYVRPTHNSGYVSPALCAEEERAQAECEAVLRRYHNWGVLYTLNNGRKVWAELRG